MPIGLIKEDRRKTPWKTPMLPNPQTSLTLASSNGWIPNPHCTGVLLWKGELCVLNSCIVKYWLRFRNKVVIGQPQCYLFQVLLSLRHTLARIWLWRPQHTSSVKSKIHTFLKHNIYTEFLRVQGSTNENNVVRVGERAWWHRDYFCSTCLPSTGHFPLLNWEIMLTLTLC